MLDNGLDYSNNRNHNQFDDYDSSQANQDDYGSAQKRNGKNAEASKSALFMGSNRDNIGVLPTLTSKSSLAQSDVSDDLIFAKYNFYWISKKENNKIYQILIELSHQCTVLEAVEKTLPFFNQEFASAKANFTLDLDPHLYDLYFAKKTGHPKSDYPALDDTQNLNQTSIQNFCLVEANPNAILKVGDSSPTKTKSNNRSVINEVDSADRRSMVDHSMPGGYSSNTNSVPSNFNYGTQRDEDVQETKKCCFCIPMGEKNQQPTEKSLSMQVGDAGIKKPLMA